MPRRTAAHNHKVLCDKTFNITKNPKHDGCQRGLGSMVYKYFDKNSSGIKGKIIPNQQLAEELHKPIIQKLEKRKVNSLFRVLI